MIKRELKIALVFSIIHFIVGNIIGINMINSIFLELIGLPYTFIAGMSQFAGWDYLSLIFEICSFVFMTMLFYPIGLLIKKNKS